MAAPRRGNTGYSCDFITSSTFQKRNILQSDRMTKAEVGIVSCGFKLGHGRYFLAFGWRSAFGAAIQWQAC